MHKRKCGCFADEKAGSRKTNALNHKMGGIEILSASCEIRARD